MRNETPALRFEDIPYPERLLVWAIRICYAPQVTDEETNRALIQAFRFANIEPALAEFAGYANAIATCLLDQQLTIDIHCPPCPSVGRDEWLIVQTIAALQVRDRMLANSYLESLLPPSGVRICGDMGTVLARTLRLLGCHLRSPDLQPPAAALHCRHDAMHSSSQTKPVIH